MLIATGVVVLTVMSFPITAYLLTQAIEGQAGRYVDPGELRNKGVKYIVVLGAEFVTFERTPADRFGQGLPRLMEGIRLWKGIPGSVLVLSGGSAPGRSSEKDALADLPIELGIPREALILENRAMDTEDEARFFREILGKQPFALVTSAGHMSRAVRLFEMVGTKPVPCPCDFGSLSMPPGYSWFLPSSSALGDSQKVIHNYLGEVWLTVKTLLRPNALKTAEASMRHACDQAYR
jgi:uncharacterized SAM-binding protein YcdF (DUF218 family)